MIINLLTNHPWSKACPGGFVAQVRTIPRSRTNPQFNKEAMAAELPKLHGCQYEWLGKVGIHESGCKTGRAGRAGWSDWLFFQNSHSYAFSR
jgi:hypothetical protein